MAKPSQTKLNWLHHHLPDGLLVDAAWLGAQGFSTSLRSQYVARKWLDQPARRVYRRAPAKLTWQQVVISLQTLLGCPLVVGGRTALELQGYAHYLSQDLTSVYLYGPKRPPAWLDTLPVEVRFLYRNDRRLFPGESGNSTLQHLDRSERPLTLSTPERAILELLDELPRHESFHQADKLMESLTTLSPRRLQTLLTECRSVKVKRLFLFFAERHKHPWLKRIQRDAIDLGTGNRMLVRGGTLDPTFRITVPKDLDGVQ